MQQPADLPAAPIKDQLHRALAELTPTERKLARHLLDHFPVAGLGSITTLARAADVSTPSVVRLVQKLGFKGYPDFQHCLRAEVEDMLASPLAKYGKWSGAAPEGHLLPRFAGQVVANVEATLAAIDPAEFDAIAGLLADPDRRIYAMGGRVTQSVAEYMVTLLATLRPGVQLLSALPNTWAPALLDMQPGDIVVLFDIRRYENAVLHMAELARDQGAEVILFTDRWISPAAARARHVLACHVEAPSAWDSTVSITALLEALLAAVQTLRWQDTAARLNRLETLYDRVQFFRRHRQTRPD